MAEGVRSKGEATREALMDAGFAVFARKGFLRTQIGDIVREAGKSTGVFHIYFKNKDALLDAWLDRCDELVPWYQAETDLLFGKAHRFVLDSYWLLYERFGPVLEALNAAATASDHFRGRLDDARRQSHASIARMIRSAQSEGRCRGIDPELTAISIGAMITQTTAHWFRHRAEMEMRGIDRAVFVDHLEALYARTLELSAPSGTAEVAPPLESALAGQGR